MSAKDLVNKLVELSYETGRKMGRGVSILMYEPLIIQREKVRQEVIDVIERQKNDVGNGR